MHQARGVSVRVWLRRSPSDLEEDNKLSTDRDHAHFVQQGGDKTRFGQPYEARPTKAEIDAGAPGTESFRGEPTIGQRAMSPVDDAQPQMGSEPIVGYKPDQPPAD